ncbi:hypothetical protein SteCoe_33753 [Stentor coeruleus]|uniref:Ubiquitin-like domain-containing protein n=1 Tax=Stentor coeruleus TaxID=5963 RepID=A0A1R2AW36_9CILI|nr:hypothetical protein SteCoe_33753 [Stentor coeruleus]
MEVKVVSRSGKDLGTFKVPQEILVKDFKKKFSEKFKNWGPERQRFCIKSTTGPVVDNDSELLVKFLGEERVLCFKDLGLQLSWRLVYMIEYAGPILIAPLLYYFPKQIYGIETVKTPTQT